MNLGAKLGPPDRMKRRRRSPWLILIAMTAVVLWLVLEEPPWQPSSSSEDSTASSGRTREVISPLAGGPYGRQGAREPAGEAENEPYVAVSEAIVHGSVMDDLGNPIARARVIVASASAATANAPVHEAIAGADGGFELRLPAVDPSWDVVASATGHLTRRAKASVGRAVMLTLPRAARLEGRVLAPDPGEVHVFTTQPRWSDGERDSSRRRASDGTGAYAVEDVPVGSRVELEIFPDGCSPYSEFVDIPRAGTIEHDIDLGQVVRVEISVEDALSGRPVPEATLFLSKRPIAVSDSNGRIQLRLVGALARWIEGSASDVAQVSSGLEASAPGYCRTSLPLLATDVRIALMPAGRIEGRVLFDDGEPARGAFVAWEYPHEIRDPDGQCYRNGRQSSETTTSTGRPRQD